MKLLEEILEKMTEEGYTSGEQLNKGKSQIQQIVLECIAAESRSEIIKNLKEKGLLE